LLIADCALTFQLHPCDILLVMNGFFSYVVLPYHIFLLRPVPILTRFFYTDCCLTMHRLVQFVDSYDPPIKGLHEDLNFVSPRIGEVILMSSFSIV
jgi:hypothetical protein